MNPLLYTDFYKIHHQNMYPDNTTMIYSNFTPRKSRMKGVDSIVFFGLQHFILEYLIKKFNEDFFGSKLGYRTKEKKDSIIEQYKKHCPVDTKHIEALWDLGYLPIEIKALEEGTLCPIGVPCMTIKNTHPEFGWLTNYLETIISTEMWLPITSATIAYEYKKLLSKYALETTGSTEGVQWQAHDFSLRGMSSIESGITSGMAHLTSFTGTDCIPAIYQLEESYDASGLIGASVPATEHSVMCMGTKDDEVGTFKRLLDKYPEGILSVVSDTWDLWKVLTEYLPALKDQILAREGKLVIRPDSGDPVDIICGIPTIDNLLEDKDWMYIIQEEGRIVSNGILYTFNTKSYESDLREYGENHVASNGIKEYINESKISINETKGVIELLWDIFGGNFNEQGYKVLDSHIGAIYGDSITLERAEEIMDRLKAKRFASSNIVFGVGSFTYQYNTRDTFGFAMKATYGEVNGVGQEIYKDPITDDGTKKSKKGLLEVHANKEGVLVVSDQNSWDDENTGLLTTVFKDSKLVKRTSLEQIRERLR